MASSRVRGWGRGFALALLGTILPTAPGVAQPSLPAGFTDTLVTSVGSPTSIAFLPDGRMLITTQGGTVRIFDGATLLATPALNISSSICSNGERGLLGIAIDPDFSANQRIYLFYTHRNNGSCATGSTAGPWNRVSRFTFSSTNTINPASEQVLLDGIWSFGGNHNAGDLAFGGDGLLYVTTGDGGTDYGGSGSAGANDAARERHHLLGKIVRITRDGEVPGGNPFSGPNTGRCNTGPLPAGQICQEIYAWGLRNPFRIAFNPNAGNAEFYINDVGQGTWEEIDVGQAGADYGWNVREGFCANGSTTQCPPASPTPAGMTEPLFAYRHGTTLPGTQTGGCNSISGGAFVPNGAWPAEFDDTYLFADYVCGAIFALRRNGNSVSVSDFVRNLGGSSAVHLRFGPFGGSQALYYTTYAQGGQVRRVVSATSANLPPTAAISANPASGPTPLQVTFSAAGSGDPNAGDTLTYFWNFGDGSAEQSSPNLTIAHTYTVAGIYTATLRARDSSGAFSQPVSLQIAVGNRPPVVTMNAPASGFSYAVGATVALSATATDPEQGVLPASALSWRIILHHGEHTHPYLGPLQGNNLSFQAPAPEDLLAATNSFLEVVVEATDASGAVAAASRNIQPRKVNLTFHTDPLGLDLRVNSQTIPGGTTVTSWENYLLSVSAPTQTRNDVEFEFDSWLDGAPPNRAILTPPSPASYTAKFRPATATGGLTTVGAGSFLPGPLARGAIVSGFGEQLAPGTQSASSIPLPTQMQGVAVRLVDSGGTSQNLPLFLVSPTQLNFLIPGTAQTGAARLEVLRGAAVIASQSVLIADSSPSVFTANQDGHGVPAAEVVRVAADGAQTVSAPFTCAGTPSVCSPAPINLGGVTDTAYLILYATGLRNRPPGTNVLVTIQGIPAVVEYAGPQPQFEGLDQVNVILPKVLRGTGNATVQLTIGAVSANPVEVRIQ